MRTATITSKGQVTLPKQVREALGLRLGDQVVFVVEHGRAVLHPVQKTGLQDLRGIARRRPPFVSRDAEREAAQSLASQNARGQR
jgi:antitoxin PrlF